MEASLRNTPALIVKIEQTQNELIRRFENILSLASTEKTDRNSTAVAQFQMKVETGALIRAAEDVQTLIRQMQEAWLFGQLNVVGGQNELQRETDAKAKEVATLLQQLVERQDVATANGENSGTNETANGSP